MSGYPALGGWLVFSHFPVDEEAIVHIGGDNLDHVALLQTNLILRDGRVGASHASTVWNITSIVAGADLLASIIIMVLAQINC